MCGPTVKPSVKFFKPEDFQGGALMNMSSYPAAEMANAKLLKEAKVVYSNKVTGSGWLFTQGEPPTETTHTALLICTEPIVKCDHKIEDVIDNSIIDHCEFRCKCGAKLKQVITYEEIK